MILTCLKPCEFPVSGMNSEAGRFLGSLAWGLDRGRWWLLLLMARTLPSDPAGNGEGSTSGAVKCLMAGLERLAIAEVWMLSGAASECAVHRNMSYFTELVGCFFFLRMLQGFQRSDAM